MAIKHFIFIGLLFTCCTSFAQTKKNTAQKKKAVAIKTTASIKKAADACPLIMYSAEFSKLQYALCNTAATANYMSRTEKNVIWILNIVNAYPKIFAKEVVEKYPDRSGRSYLKEDSFYFQSLLVTLNKMKAQAILQPSKKCFESAFCHAATSGKVGYVGHDRQTTNCAVLQYFNGECADYGHNDAFEIIMALLIDRDVPSLGHRTICLYGFEVVGVSIQPHTTYGHNAVLDFKF